MANTLTDPDALLGLTVIGTGGEDLGTVDSVLASDETGSPEWVVLSRAGERTAPLPLGNAVVDDGTLCVPHDAHALRTAPHGPEEHLTPAQRSELLEHYGVVVAERTGRHAAGRHGPVEDDRAERDEVAASADGVTAADAPDVGDAGVPGVRRG